MAPLLRVNDLRTSFLTSDGEVRAVDGVTFDIEDGQTVGLVGESGCGKSVTALSIIQLLPKGTGRIVGGEILYRGQDLASLTQEEVRHIRGNEISMIFQEPMTSLNPVMTIGDQIAETVRLHRRAGRREARERAIEMLGLVKIAEAQKRIGSYPHQLSGGQRQRVMIAMALACTPKLLIADEPTTALDVTIQAQILELIGELQQRLGMAVLLITHDLGVVAERADEVAVMYAGKIVERAKPEVIFSRPDASLHGRAVEFDAGQPRRSEEAVAGDSRNGAQSARLADGMPFPGALRARRRRLRPGAAAVDRDRAAPSVACFKVA